MREGVYVGICVRVGVDVGKCVHMSVGVRVSACFGLCLGCHRVALFSLLFSTVVCYSIVSERISFMFLAAAG